MQYTFGEIVGMETLVPVGPHADDLVNCSDDVVRRHCDVLYDCEGDAHGNEEARHEADVTIVTDLLMKEGEWVMEYTTENEDYPADYLCIAEGSDWTRPIKDWLVDHYGDDYGSTRFDYCIDDIVSRVGEDIDDCSDCEFEYHPSEYASYSGSGCCLFSFAIDEHAEQIEVGNYPTLLDLHNSGRLNDVLDDVNCDVYISRFRRREKNEATGYYEDVGRETYDRGGNYPVLDAYHMPGGQWQFVISEERMALAAGNAIVALARSEA